MITELIQERVIIEHPRGSLSGELVYGPGEPRGAVLLVGPHPYMGGSMENPLLLRLAEALADLGCVCLKFDYGGVGESGGIRVDVEHAMAQFWKTGHAPQDDLLLDDARSAAGWLEAVAGLPQIVIGYSFGAYAATTAVASAARGLVLIAPTLQQHRLTLPVSPGLRCKLIAAGQDFATPGEVTRNWITAQRPGSLSVETFEPADHFFRGLETAVARSCSDFCRGLLEEARA